jgi:endonuclease G
MRPFFTVVFSILYLASVSQENYVDRIHSLEDSIAEKRNEINALIEKADSLKLLNFSERLIAMGWPGTEGELVQHSGFALSYSEEHEMASWVAHILSKEVAEGRTGRTNDFRVDPKVSTGSAEEKDYFLTSKGTDGETEYDGFGYDRGHLAPSADFRWNQKALSETYYYSNMTPQHPDFNRGIWAELEANIREYVIENDVDLYVVTGPVLTNDLPKVERSVNGMSLPRFHFKVILDQENRKAIGFIMPNMLCEKPIEAYAASVDKIEETTGLDFYSSLPDELDSLVESQLDYHDWLPAAQRDGVSIISPSILAKGRYNTLQAYEFADTKKKIEVCGTVVSTFKSKNNNIFVNLDKKYPNTIFTLTIWARNAANFSYPPEQDLLNERICVKGEVNMRENVMQMNLINEKQITFLNDGF